jgi:hypothetical protein
MFVGWSPDAQTIVVSDPQRHETLLLDPSSGGHRPASWADTGGSSWQRLAR